MNDIILNTCSKLISTGAGTGTTNFYAIMYLISGIIVVPVMIYLVLKWLLRN